MKAKMKNLETIAYENNMLLGVHDKPKLRSWILLAIQHVVAMFGATVLIPMFINGSAHEEVISTEVALFASGVGTLIYIALTRAKVPMYLGSSGAYVASTASLYTVYGTSAFFGFLGVGLVYLVVSIFIYLYGTAWLKKLLPPVVIGSMIMVIGLGLAAYAIQWLGIDANNFGKTNWMGLGIGFISTIVAITVALVSRGKAKLVPILAGLVTGLILSLIASTWDDSIHAATFGKYGRNWDETNTYIGLPDFSKSMLSGHNAKAGMGWSIVPFFVMMPIAFSTIAEHIGDHTVLGKITGKDYINGAPGLHRTLLGDGIATAVAGVLGGPANTSYGENTTTIGLSRVGSVWVTGLAAVIAVLMSFIKIVPSILGLIPNFVLGGVGIVLFGFIAMNGMKVLVDKKVNVHDTRNIFIMSIMLIIGLGGAVLGGTIDSTQIQFSSSAVAMILGMVANAVMPQDRGFDESKMPQISEYKMPNKFKRKNKQ